MCFRQNPTAFMTLCCYLVADGSCSDVLLLLRHGIRILKGSTGGQGDAWPARRDTVIDDHGGTSLAFSRWFTFSHMWIADCYITRILGEEGKDVHDPQDRSEGEAERENHSWTDICNFAAALPFPSIIDQKHCQLYLIIFIAVILSFRSSLKPYEVASDRQLEQGRNVKRRLPLESIRSCLKHVLHIPCICSTFHEKLFHLSLSDSTLCVRAYSQSIELKTAITELTCPVCT